jgi:hypothetical protein
MKARIKTPSLKLKPQNVSQDSYKVKENERNALSKENNLSKGPAKENNSSKIL